MDKLPPLATAGQTHKQTKYRNIRISYQCTPTAVQGIKSIRARIIRNYRIDKTPKPEELQPIPKQTVKKRQRNQLIRQDFPARGQDVQRVQSE